MTISNFVMSAVYRYMFETESRRHKPPGHTDYLKQAAAMAKARRIPRDRFTELAGAAYGTVRPPRKRARPK
jgi:hypothetical protein